MIEIPNPPLDNVLRGYKPIDEISQVFIKIYFGLPIDERWEISDIVWDLTTKFKRMNNNKNYRMTRTKTFELVARLGTFLVINRIEE